MCAHYEFWTLANFVLVLCFCCGTSDTLIKKIIYNHWLHRLYGMETLTPTNKYKISYAKREAS